MSPESHEQQKNKEELALEHALDFLKKNDQLTAAAALGLAMKELGIPEDAYEERGRYRATLTKRLEAMRPQIKKENRQASAWSDRLAEKASTEPNRPDVARQDDKFPPPGSEEE